MDTRRLYNKKQWIQGLFGACFLICLTAEAKISECQAKCVSLRDKCYEKAADNEKKIDKCRKEFLKCAIKCENV